MEEEEGMVEILDLETDFIDDYVSDDTEAQLTTFLEYGDEDEENFFGEGADQTGILFDF